MKATAILDEFGKPFKLNGHSRMDLLGLALKQRPPRRAIRARYDAAADTDFLGNYWANADTLDADSANSRQVRQALVARSRYEVANNPYVDGAVQTHANYLVGIAPTLRMQTGNTAFNQVVELIWFQWCKAMQLRRKLWCMAHAKVQDGEAFGILINNRGLKTRVKLDIRLIETEQVQSTEFSLLDDNHIDGIKFDDNGNVLYYEVLPHHPGINRGGFFEEAERVREQFMLHWFTQRRPGQHRGVPEFTSSLNTGATSRRMREATVKAAEVAATLGAVLISSNLPPNVDEAPDPMTTVNLENGMMTTLPDGYAAAQMKPEQPGQAYESFLRQQINETARPKSMPFNIAACDSAGYNYASGRLDHQTYFSAIEVEREECNDLVLDKLFGHWWVEAVAEYDWESFGNTPAHTWDWPKHPVADIRSEALANDLRLKNGSATLPRTFAEAGLDAEDEAIKAAEYFGIPVEEYKRRQLDALFPAPKPVAAPDGAAPPDDEDEEDDEDADS